MPHIHNNNIVISPYACRHPISTASSTELFVILFLYHYLGHSNDYLLLSLKCSFVFPGVYVDSTQEIPFSIENKGKSYAKVTIDLTEHDDFTLHFQSGIS